MRSNFLTNTFNQLSNHRIPYRRNSSTATANTSRPRRPRLMCVLAHPDDEALCVGGTLAKYAAQGVEISLVVATRGERGWRGAPQDNPGLYKMGEIREAELRASARVLGVSELHFLDYLDGDVSIVPFDELVAKIVTQVRRFRPEVVITFDPHGMYGHPDHITISQATTSAVWSAADPQYQVADRHQSYRVPKLYYRVYSQNALKQYQEIFGELKMRIAEDERVATPWHPWAITTHLDVQPQSEQIWAAITCHRSQLQVTKALQTRFREYQALDLGTETYYQVFHFASSNALETDLFAGLSASTKIMADTVIARSALGDAL